MTGAKQGARSPLKIVAIVVAVLAALLLTMAGFRISDYAKGHAYDYDARDYIYAAESGRFGDLYDTAIRDMGKQARYSTEVAECRALAFYYEQAVLERAYRESGDTTKANECALRMKEYEQQLGSLSAKAQVVRDRVESASQGLA